MATWNDAKIREWGAMGGTVPFKLEHVNPASYDISIGANAIDIGTGKSLQTPIELRPPSATRSFLAKCLNWIPGVNIRTFPTAVLLETLEVVMIPDHIGAEVKLKTTPARLGIDHTMAGWIDPGFVGRLTLTLYTRQNVVLRPGTRIAQIVFHELNDMAENPYNGHYQAYYEPVPAHEDVKGEFDVRTK